MRYKIEIRSIWEFGQRKDENGNPHQEDSLFPAHGKSQPEDRVFILCDGMGGHAAGEVASATVCEAMSKSLLPQKEVYSDKDIATAVTDAYDTLDTIDSHSEGKSKMGTTMTCLVLHEGGATIAHMGDSRVYHIRPGKEREDTKILFQTRDHSLVNDLVAIGEITPEEAKTHPRKNVITRALQPHVENRQRADVKTTVDVKPGDWFYLCSDGMLEQMDDSTIRFIFSEATGDIDSKVEMLTQATRENRDNHTAFLIHILEVEDPIHVKEEPSDVLPPLMGTIEDDPQTTRKNDLDEDKSTEIDLTSEDTNNSGLHEKHAINPIIRLRIIGLLLLAIVIVFSGVYFAKTFFTKPAEKEEPAKTEQKIEKRKPRKKSPAPKQTPKKEVIQKEIAEKEYKIDSLQKMSGEEITAQIAALKSDTNKLNKQLQQILAQEEDE